MLIEERIELMRIIILVGQKINIHGNHDYNTSRIIKASAKYFASLCDNEDTLNDEIINILDDYFIGLEITINNLESRINDLTAENLAYFKERLKNNPIIDDTDGVL